MNYQEEKKLRSYGSVYLEYAQRTLGSIFDIVHNDTDYNIDDFMQYFIDSRLAHGFGRGNAREHGRSGLELIMETLEITNNPPIIDKEYCAYGSTSAFWAGWILAFYQWYTKQTFEEINKYLKPSNIIGMYILHEASEMTFIDRANNIREEYYKSLSDKEKK